MWSKTQIDELLATIAAEEWAEWEALKEDYEWAMAGLDPA